MKFKFVQNVERWKEDEIGSCVEEITNSKFQIINYKLKITN
jgi:hypothetical protein